MKIPTLYTERLMIRPISILDADDMYEYAKTSYVGPSAGWPPHTSVQDTLAVIKNIISVPVPEGIGNWAIVLKSSGKMIGTIELYNYSYSFKAEIGYSINPAYWNMGFATEAVSEIVAYGFEFLNLKRIEAGTFIDNYQSQKVLEKIGFKKEGTLRNSYLRYDGKIFDKVVFGITIEDYHNLYK